MLESKLERQVLLITTKDDLSADLLITGLRKLSATLVRWNLEDFPLSSSVSWDPSGAGRSITIDGHNWPFKAFQSAWYRRTAPPSLPSEIEREGLKDFVTKEVEVFLDGVWETSKWFWVNRPSIVRAAENKLVQLAAARKLGFIVPQTLMTNDPHLTRRFLREQPSSIAKSIASSAININGAPCALFANAISEEMLASSSALQISPCIFQERVKRKSDIRITVVDSEMFAAEITMKEAREYEVDWRAVEAKLLNYRPHFLPNEVKERCSLLMKNFGLVYGCFDLLLTPSGDYVFLEINPSGQWGWIEHELGFQITEAIARLLTRAQA